jgi:hypothetical protein
VRPTRVSTLLAVTAALAVVGYLVAEAAYGSLPELPLGAPLTMFLLAVAELAMAKLVRDRVLHRRDARGRAPRRPLHPVQVARAAALAKASSVTGAVLGGAYAGLFAWTAQRADVLAAAADDVVVSGLSALAAVLLVVSALLLERACRVPEPPDDEDTRLGSQA